MSDDADTNEARLAAHRRLHNPNLPSHPDAVNRIDLRDLDTDRLARTKLVDLGWTPPKHLIDKPQVPTVAFMHPVADLVTTDPHSYTNLSTGSPRELVLKADVYDHIDWLKHGIDEWRGVAVEFQKTNRELRSQLALVQAELSRLQVDELSSDPPPPAPGA
ncbi:MAG: hypothetical protein K2W33_10645 [Burkholderiales bacterium]|nr:hypothetical protein [Burkholderiales bacterium]